MDKLIEQIAEILEIDKIDVDSKFTDYEEWDSLCSLAIIAMLDSDYKMTMTNKELLTFNSIKDFCEFVIK